MRSHAPARLADEVSAALKRCGLGRADYILLGLSGGPDSVALLHALLAVRPRFGYRLAAAHLNHGLRGADSDRDEAFVRELCARTGVELFAERARDLAPAAGNLEERARALRHRFLKRTADRIGATRIALAHHRDDQAETVLMRLLRGAGAAGLKAMGEKGPGRLIRPMLKLARADLRAYLDAVGEGFVLDLSNESDSALRNRVRKHLLPALEREYAPGFARRLVALATEMRQLDEFIEEAAAGELERRLAADGTLELGGFEALHPALAAALLRSFIKARVHGLRRIERSHIEALLRLCTVGPPNGCVDLPGGWHARREYGRFGLDGGPAVSAARFALVLAVPGSTPLVEARLSFECALTEDIATPAPGPPFVAVFDAERMAGRFVVRNFLPGDRIRPLGAGGTRKVKEIFIEHKVPRARRALFPVVTIEGGTVVWLPGLARGDGALVTPKTRRVVRIEARAR